MAEDTFSVVFTGLVKPVHIKLPDEAIDFPMAEIFREDDFLELVDVFNDEISTGGSPEYNFGILVVLNKQTITFKISKVLATKPAISGSWHWESYSSGMLL